MRDPDQTALTVIGQSWVNALTAGEQAAASVAVLAILNRVRVKDADGIWWVIDDGAQTVDAGHFGAVSDASENYGAGTVSGTGNADAIQALIDWRVYLRQGTPSGEQECLIPAGMYRVERGLQLGYGDDFRTVRLRGAGRGRAARGGGTTLWFDFANQPGIAIHVGRSSGVSDMNLVSPGGRALIYNKQLGGIEHPSMTNFGIDDRDLTSWNDPAQPLRSAVLRYNPHAAIAFDPYAGAQPVAPGAWTLNSAIAKGTYRIANGKLYLAREGGTTATSGTGPSAATGWKIVDGTVVWSYIGPAGTAVAYPSAPGPAFLPAASRITYGKSVGSSKMPVDNVSIDGFAVGVAVMPGDADGNGDFLSLSDVSVINCPIIVSIGQTQARSNDFVRVDAAFFHTLLTGLSHGRQSGRTEGIWTECTGSSGIQLLNVGAQAAAGQHQFNGYYQEGLWRLGELSSAGATGSQITFNGGTISFYFHATTNGRRGVPLYLLGRDDSPTGAGGEAMVVTFRGTDLASFEGVASLRASNVVFENASFSPNDVTSVTTPWRARALNTLAGGVVVPLLQVKGDPVIRYVSQNETVPGAANATSARRGAASSRDVPASLFSSSLSPANAISREEILNPRVIGTLDKTQITAVSLSGRTLSFSGNGWSAGRADDAGLVPGAVLYDSGQGFVFIVMTRTGTAPNYSFTCQLQNGYWTDSGGTVRTEQPFSPTLGHFRIAEGGLFTPNYPLFADCGANSATLTRVQRGDEWAGFIQTSAPVAVGDRLMADSFCDFDMLPSGGRVTAVTPGVFPAASITLAAPMRAAGVRKRFPLWVRGL